MQGHAASATEGPLAPSELDIEHHLPAGWGPGLWGRLLFWIGVAFSTFQIATAIYAILPTQVLRAVHVGFLILVGSALIANHRADSTLMRALGWAIGIAGFCVGLYHWVFYIDLVNRAGELENADLYVGVASLVILFAVAWRLMGPALPLICIGFMAYGAYGHLLPQPFDHRPFDLGQIIGREGRVAGEVVIETIFNGRADSHLGARVKGLYCHGEHMRHVVADQLKRFRILFGDDADLGIFLDAPE